MQTFAVLFYLAVAAAFFYVGVCTSKTEKGEPLVAILTALFWPVSALAVIVHARHWRENHALYFQERGL